MLGRYDRAMRARQPQGGAPFTPRAIGAAVWYDPSDLSTLFQDPAGTTPVTAVGQQVGRMLDKSGRGNHATQSTLTSRPILQQDASGRYYLACDGVDDGMVTSAIDFTATSKITLCTGIRKLSDAAFGCVAETGLSTDATQRTFGLITRTQPGYSFVSFGTVRSSASVFSGYPSPETAVLTGIGDIANDVATLRRNGVQIATSTTDQGTGTYGNEVLYLFRRFGSTLPFNGRFYGLSIGPSLLSAADLTRLETYMNRKTGAY
jgi:hypothetical protein